MPAWAASIVLHVVLFVVLGLTLQLVQKGVSAEGESELAGEIVLKHHTEQGDFYESQQDAKSQSDSTAVKSPSDVISEKPPVDPSVQLPQGTIGNPSASKPQGFGSEGLLSNPSQPRAGTGGGTKTKFYDIESQGDSFVFVIDRSASMNHSGRLAAAKAELIAALSHLKKTNQFQIIFYNSDLQVFRPRANRAFFADGPTIELAKRFIRGITPDGPTDAFGSALRKAISYQPDVIYFLTDAEDIALSEAEVGLFTRNNRGASIHTIKFGEGATERVPWLLKLSSQNAGQYRYVDTRQFGSRR